MTREEFLSQMLVVLEREDEITFDTVLADLDEWDSLSIMATMAFLKKNFGLSLTYEDINEFNTIGDIAKKAGIYAE